MKKFFILFPALLLTLFSFAQLQLPLDFESPTLNYTFTDFGGGAATKIANPQISGINTSANVARMIKGAGEVYGGSLLTLANPIDFSVNKTFKVKVFSPRVGAKLLLKVENATDGSINFEREATSTVANAWEDLTFDYTTISTTNQYSKVVFIFDLGTAGNGTANFTWLFDDVRLITAGGGGGGGGTQMNLPVTFDDVTVNYGLVGFAGADQSSIVVDPTLASNKVAKVIRTNTAETYAGTTITALSGTVQTGFSGNIPFTASEKRMNVRVYSPHAGIQVRLKVENKNDPTQSCETEATVTTANGWQTLEFNFANQAAGTSALNLAFALNKVTIFFNFGVTGATAGERIYYFDDVKFGPAAGGGGGGSTLPVLPLDFESATLNYTFTDFGGGVATKIANPQINGLNTSANVARMVKGAGEVYGGSFISLANPIDFSVNKIFKVKVFSPRVGAKLLLKVENATDGGINFEREVTSTVANAWEDLTFDYTTISTTNQYSKLVFIFDLGTAGNGTANFTWLFDDVRLIPAGGGGGGTTQMNLPVTFDDVTVNYGLVGFAGAEQSTIVTDPTLATNKVAKVIRTNTAEIYAGTTITALSGTVQTGFSGNIPFTATEKRMNVRVYSPHAGIQVRLKVEDKNDPTKSCETEATVTTVNGWQTLEFDFANQVTGTAALNLAFNLNKATIFFNFGITGAVAGERTYYFDDVKFGAAAGGGGGLTQMNLPVTFDATTVDYGLVGFAGAEQSTIVTDPTLATNKVAKVIKTNTAELYAGTTVTALSGTVQTGFSSNIPFTATEKRMNVRVYSPHAGIQVRLKVEDKNDPTKSCETEATVTTVNGWQTLEFNFANQAAGTAALNLTYNLNKATIFFNFGVTGATAGERIYYFDDVKFGAATGGGGLTQMDLPVTFDVATVDYGLVGFAGAEQSTIVADPTLATNKVAKVIKTNTAELYAGTTVTALNGTVQTGFSNNIPFTATSRRMNVRVYSPHAGIQVRLKVEDKNDPTKSCETEATVTTANTWQTLEFNFANQAPGTAALNLSYSLNKATIFFNFGVTGATAGERIYYFDDVKFGPGNVPPAPTVTSPVSYCQNGTAVALSATAQAGNSLSWYTAATGGVASATAPTPATTNVGSTNYYVSQTNGAGIEGPRATIVVTINALPAAPTVGTITYCQNATAVPLTATAAAGNSLRWYTAATGGTGSATAPTPSTTIAGNTLYYVSQVNANGCEGARAALTVTVNALPAAPTVVTPLQICLNATSTTLTATAATGNSLLWYAAATGGAASVNAPATITSIVGSTTYYVSQRNSLGCESQRAVLVATIVAPPTAPVIAATPGTQLVPGQTITIAAATGPGTGNTYAWFRNGILLPLQTGNSIPVNVDGVGSYTVKIENTIGCQSTSNTVVITGAASNKLFVYPTPSTGKFQVRYFTETNNLQPLQMAIYNTAGALVYKAQYTIFSNYTPMAVDLTRHGNGFYYIHLLSSSGQVLATESVMVHQ